MVFGSAVAAPYCRCCGCTCIVVVHAALLMYMDTARIVAAQDAHGHGDMYLTTHCCTNTCLYNTAQTCACIAMHECICTDYQRNIHRDPSPALGALDVVYSPMQAALSPTDLAPWTTTTMLTVTGYLLLPRLGVLPSHSAKSALRRVGTTSMCTLA
jgi:hypothetical protein